MKKVLLALAYHVSRPFPFAQTYLWYEGFKLPQWPDHLGNTNSVHPYGLRHSGTASPYDAIVTTTQLQIGSSGTGGRQDDIHRWLTITNGGPYTNTPPILYMPA